MFIMLSAGRNQSDVGMDDLWFVDMDRIMWTRVWPQAGAAWPTGRWGHQNVYLKAHESIFIFGGATNYKLVTDLMWRLHVPADGPPTWSQVTHSGSFPAGRVLFCFTRVNFNGSEKLFLSGGWNANRNEIQALNTSYTGIVSTNNDNATVYWSGTPASGCEGMGGGACMNVKGVDHNEKVILLLGSSFPGSVAKDVSQFPNIS